MSHTDLATQASTLGDRSHQKRELAAISVEMTVRQIMNNDINSHPSFLHHPIPSAMSVFLSQNQSYADIIYRRTDQIQKVVNYLLINYIDSDQPNHRKGGLLGLSGVILALTTKRNTLTYEGITYLSEIIPIIEKCLEDEESSVRYYACETLYNVMKVARYHIILYFNLIFNQIQILCDDEELMVRQSNRCVNRLLQDIACTCDNFKIKPFINVLQDLVRHKSFHVRELGLDWILAMDGEPDIYMLTHLPLFLNPLFAMLVDRQRKLRTLTESLMNDFLSEISDYLLRNELHSQEKYNIEKIVRNLVSIIMSTNEELKLLTIYNNYQNYNDIDVYYNDTKGYQTTKRTTKGYRTTNGKKKKKKRKKNDSKSKNRMITKLKTKVEIEGESDVADMEGVTVDSDTDMSDYQDGENETSDDWNENTTDDDILDVDEILDPLFSETNKKKKKKKGKKKYYKVKINRDITGTTIIINQNAIHGTRDGVNDVYSTEDEYDGKESDSNRNRNTNGRRIRNERRFSMDSCMSDFSYAISIENGHTKQREVALQWLDQFIILGGIRLKKLYPNILQSILFAMNDISIQAKAILLNGHLMELVLNLEMYEMNKTFIAQMEKEDEMMPDMSISPMAPALMDEIIINLDNSISKSAEFELNSKTESMDDEKVNELAVVSENINADDEQACIVFNKYESFDIKRILQILMDVLQNSDCVIRSQIASLEWLAALLNDLPLHYIPISKLLKVCFLRLCDNYEQKNGDSVEFASSQLLQKQRILQSGADLQSLVIEIDLKVLALLSLHPKIFDQLLNNLLNLFYLQPHVLNTRGQLIITKLCSLLDCTIIYCHISKIIFNEYFVELNSNKNVKKIENDEKIDEKEKNEIQTNIIIDDGLKEVQKKKHQFVQQIVRLMNIILLTSKELYPLRAIIKHCRENSENADIFLVLYQTWCCSPISLLSLCLLAQEYSIGLLLINNFESNVHIHRSLHFLFEIDEFVHLLESPIFLHLRMQLLLTANEKWKELFSIFNGILTLLPNSDAFHQFRIRIEMISMYNRLFQQLFVQWTDDNLDNQLMNNAFNFKCKPNIEHQIIDKVKLFEIYIHRQEVVAQFVGY